MTLHRLASLVFNRPHYITREAGLAIANVILRGQSPGANRFIGEDQFERDANGRVVTDAWGNPKPLGYRMAGATAIVNVLGETVNRGAWLNARSGLVSYEGLATQLRAAAADPRAKRLLLDVNSPGGEASGMTDIAALVRAIAAEKPVVAVANSMMCSAAYGLCSGATRIVTTDLGVVGSIGVVMMHADYSGALDKAGIDVTLIHEGAHKVDGNPFEALPKAVREDFQAECAKYYDAFVACVAEGRPGLTDAAIRDTEARTYLGAEAVDAGLADDVGTFEEVLAELESGGLATRTAIPARTHTRTARTEEHPVTLKAKTKTAAKAATPAEADEESETDVEAPAAQPAAKIYTQAELDAAVAQATAAGKASGRTEERARIKGIVGHAAAEGRGELAAHLAYETDTTAEASVALLEKAPKAAAKTPAPAATGETLMGMELAHPAPAAKPAAAKVDAGAVYARRRKNES